RELGGPLDHFHQSVVLTTPAGLTEAALTGALQAVIDHHDMFRARLVEGELEVRPAGAVRAADCLRRGTDDPARRLDPAAGMIQATWLDAGPDRPGRLHLAVHHLAVD